MTELYSTTTFTVQNCSFLISASFSPSAPCQHYSARFHLVILIRLEKYHSSVSRSQDVRHHNLEHMETELDEHMLNLVTTK